MSDYFKIVDPEPIKMNKTAGEIARGDGWILTKTARQYELSYLTGHFSTEEKKISISDDVATKLINSEIDLDTAIQNTITD
jgi:hypothetical protein